MDKNLTLKAYRSNHFPRFTEILDGELVGIVPSLKLFIFSELKSTETYYILYTVVTAIRKSEVTQDDGNIWFSGNWETIFFNYYYIWSIRELLLERTAV